MRVTRTSVRMLAIAASLTITACEGAPPPPRTATDSSAPGLGSLKVGDVAPDFTLPGSDDRTYSLATYRGRQAVVLAWFAKAFTSG
jgi:hypothetical protein